MLVGLVILVTVGNGLIVIVSERLTGASQPGKSNTYSIPSTRTFPLFLVNVISSVLTPVIKVMCCNILFGPALKISVVTPSVIVTLPALLFLAKLIVIGVPAGNTSPKVITTTRFALLTVVLLVAFAGVPAAKIGPTELFGLAPPVVAITFPVVGVGCSATKTTFKVVATKILVTVTVAAPVASNKTV